MTKDQSVDAITWIDCTLSIRNLGELAETKTYPTVLWAEAEGMQGLTWRQETPVQTFGQK